MRYPQGDGGTRFGLDLPSGRGGNGGSAIFNSSACIGEAEGPINPPLTFRLKLDPTHPYLAERGVSLEIAEAFGLGFCARGMMKGRICIPIHNEAGELVAYAGRWPGDSGWPEGEERYKLPPGFRKSHVLFNLNRVPDDDWHVVLVEGFFSVFRLYAIDVPAVALMGCSLSDEQIELLARRTKRITVLMDGDAAGRAARAEIVPLGGALGCLCTASSRGRLARHAR